MKGSITVGVLVVIGLLAAGGYVATQGGFELPFAVAGGRSIAVVGIADTISSTDAQPIIDRYVGLGDTVDYFNDDAIAGSVLDPYDAVILTDGVNSAGGNSAVQSGKPVLSFDGRYPSTICNSIRTRFSGVGTLSSWDAGHPIMQGASGSIHSPDEAMDTCNESPTANVVGELFGRAAIVAGESSGVRYVMFGSQDTSHLTTNGWKIVDNALDWITNTPGPSAVCGNSIVETGEACDDGAQNGQQCIASYGSSCNFCDASCQTATVQGAFCGDATCDAEESQLTCAVDCGQPPSCGDGTIDIAEGEECDDGAANGVACTAPYAGQCNYCGSDCSVKTSLGPFCGDLICESVYNEDCSSCSVDCGSCPDVTDPTVGIVFPTPGAVLEGSVTIDAIASDSETGIASVEFSIDGFPFATDTTAPYTAVWDTNILGNGLFSVGALATDGAGNTALAEVAVTVENAEDVDPPIDDPDPIVCTTCPQDNDTDDDTTTPPPSGGFDPLLIVGVIVLIGAGAFAISRAS